jgi:hypothetical protein
MSPSRTLFNKEKMLFIWHKHVIFRHEWLKDLNTIRSGSKYYENSGQDS